MKRIGLIVNPVAGLGGRVGLKGSDGPETQARALALGARPRAPQRAGTALAELAGLGDELIVLCFAGEMGQVEAEAAGLAVEVVGRPQTEPSTAVDTIHAAEAILSAGAELLIFAGGDGTARDVCQAVGPDRPVVGVPAGVKIHSGVYAVSPKKAGQLARLYLTGRIKGLTQLEIMDLDEDEFRQGRVSARLFGYMSVPLERRYIQGAKAGSGGLGREEEARQAIAAEVTAGLEPGVRYIIGSGTTPRAIMDELGLANTLLGIDVIEDGRLLAADADEKTLLRLIDGRPAKIIVTVIGGQGYIFGRGNQQISPAVIEEVGPENIIIVATKAKLASLGRRPLLVDSGDEAMDARLKGYRPVITGLKERVIHRVA